MLPGDRMGAGMARTLDHESKGLFNRDIYPAQGLIDAYPDLVSLTDNKAVDEAFARAEHKAVLWKRLYVRLGSLGLGSVFIVMAVLVCTVTLGNAYNIGGGFSWERKWGITPTNIEIAVAVIAAIGLVAQSFVFFSSAKQRWLLHRFAAERIRCLKFQAFAVLGESPDRQRLEANVAAFTREKLARLDQELLAGEAAITQFAPSVTLDYASPARGRSNAQLVAEGRKAYDDLRLAIQAQHFELMSRHHLEREHIPAMLAEFSFAGGAIAAVAQIAWTVFGQNDFGLSHARAEAWFDFVPLALFVLSAFCAVWRRATGHAVDAERYATYLRQIDRVRQQAQAEDHGDFPAMVLRMETIVLHELGDFCRAAKFSDYLF
jgi:hypothetical protein